MPKIWRTNLILIGIRWWAKLSSAARSCFGRVSRSQSSEGMLPPWCWQRTKSAVSLPETIYWRHLRPDNFWGQWISAIQLDEAAESGKTPKQKYACCDWNEKDAVAEVGHMYSAASIWFDICSVVDSQVPHLRGNLFMYHLLFCELVGLSRRAFRESIWKMRAEMATTLSKSKQETRQKRQAHDRFDKSLWLNNCASEQV